MPCSETMKRIPYKNIYKDKTQKLTSNKTKQKIEGDIIKDSDICYVLQGLSAPKPGIISVIQHSLYHVIFLLQCVINNLINQHKAAEQYDPVIQQQIGQKCSSTGL